MPAPQAPLLASTPDSALSHIAHQARQKLPGSSRQELSKPSNLSQRRREREGGREREREKRRRERKRDGKKEKQDSQRKRWSETKIERKKSGWEREKGIERVKKVNAEGGRGKECLFALASCYCGPLVNLSSGRA